MSDSACPTTGLAQNETALSQVNHVSLAIPRKKRQPNSDRVDEVVRLFFADHRQIEIATILGISTGAVASALRRQGIKPRFARGKIFKIVDGACRYTAPCGREIIFDLEDRDLLESGRWIFNGGRVVRTMPDENGETVLARMILSAQRGQIVDHINGDFADNRRANLRLATLTENLRNRRKHRLAVKSSIYKGVCRKSKNSWYAVINLGEGKKKRKTFSTEIAAAEQYDEWARTYFGKFACVNFTSPGERWALEDQSNTDAFAGRER